MKSRLTVLCVSILVCASGQPRTNDHLFPIREGKKLGFINRTGAVVVAPQYDSVAEPKEGRARVTTGALSGYIDLSGKVIVEPKYDNAEDFLGGRAIVRQDTKYMLIDLNGKVIAEIPHRVLGQFHQGLLRVQASGLTDKTGRRLPTTYGFVDTAGKLVIPPQFMPAGEFPDDPADLPVAGLDHDWCYFDRTGKVIVRIPMGEQLTNAKLFANGRLLVKEGFNWGYKDATGAWAIPLKYNDAESFKDGVARVQEGAKWILIDTSGNLVPEDKRKLKPIEPASDGLTLARENDVLGWVDAQGTLAFPLRKYEEAHSFASGRARIRLDGLYGYLDKFALLLTNPEEPVNIALAGPSHFYQKKNGLAFWLKVEKGVLSQVSAQKTEDLFPARPFIWYLVHCTYRIDAGTYDLEIHEEYQKQPIASRTGQPNVMNQPGSKLDRYSFVSNPFGNNSNALFYVDDLTIAAVSGKAPPQFVAPGRRKLFVDLFNDHRKHLAAHAVCLPVSGLADLGMNAADGHRLDAEDALEWLQQALRDGKIAPLPNSVSNNTQRQLLAFTTWKRGCEEAAQDNYKAARKLFDAAAHDAPESPLYEVSAILTAAVLQDFIEADERWGRARDRWRNDIRSGIILALLGLAHKNFDDAEAWIREPASNLSRATNEEIAAQYYYVLLWKGRYTEARAYAGQVVGFLKRQSAGASTWLERTGDALFFEQDYAQAGQSYEQALQADPRNTVPYLKLSDVWFQLGDREKERFYREGIYGALK